MRPGGVKLHAFPKKFLQTSVALRILFSELLQEKQFGDRKLPLLILHQP
jgi:hypothetical protein